MTDEERLMNAALDVIGAYERYVIDGKWGPSTADLEAAIDDLTDVVDAILFPAGG